MRNHSCAHAGISSACENQQRSERNDIIAVDILKTTHIQLWHKNPSHPRSIKGYVILPSAAVYIKNVHRFALKLLDDYAEVGTLDVTKFPNGEIWIKIGGDHGGDLMKFILQICNVNAPNSKQHTIVIGVYDGKDSHINLVMSTMTSVFSDSIHAF